MAALAAAEEEKRKAAEAKRKADAVKTKEINKTKTRKQQVNDVIDKVKAVHSNDPDMQDVINSTKFNVMDNVYDMQGNTLYGQNWDGVNVDNEVDISVNLHFDQNGILDEQELVDTIYHEVQHDRTYDNHATSQFKGEVNEHINKYNKQYHKQK